MVSKTVIECANFLKLLDLSSSPLFDQYPENWPCEAHNIVVQEPDSFLMLINAPNGHRSASAGQEARGTMNQLMTVLES